MAEKAIEFPKDFLWGTAVCSHQAEGYNVHSDWWEWEKKGKIMDGTVSGAAADMLHRYPEDFKLMRELGYNAFRLSAEWARVEPRRGRYSEDALDHYANVMREMKKNGLKVCLTLYHWPLPKWVARSGGWMSRDAVDGFRGFVEKLVERVYDDVDIWCTLNEPTAPLFAGYTLGVFPPEKRSWLQSCMVFANLLRAHAAAREVILEAARKRGATREPRIGVAMALIEFQPVNPDNPVDRKFHEFLKFAHNDAFLEAMYTGRVPPPFGVNQKISGLEQSFNFVGVNYYTRMRIQIPPKRFPRDLPDFLYLPEGTETTDMGYEVYPPGFYNILTDMSRFGVPIYVTENGMADSTDLRRPGYLLRHFRQMRRAMDDGADVRGYFLWSYIDNFEWKYGFQKKLGVVALEPGTLNRRPLASAYMYGEVARTGRVTPELARKYAPDVEEEVF